MKKYQLPHYDRVSPWTTQAARLGREVRIITFQEMRVSNYAMADMAIEARLKEWEEGALRSKISQEDPRVVGEVTRSQNSLTLAPGVGHIEEQPLARLHEVPAQEVPTPHHEVDLSEQPDDVFADDPILTFTHAKEYAQLKTESTDQPTVDAFGMEEYVACHEYNRYGRQVFTLSPVMQEMFMNTDLSRAFVDDIKLPFDCFYVQLEPGSQIPIFHAVRQDEQERVRARNHMKWNLDGDDPSLFGSKKEWEKANAQMKVIGSEVPVSGFYVSKTRRPRLHLQPDGIKRTVVRTQLTLLAVGFSEHFPKGGFPVGPPLRLTFDGEIQAVPGRPDLRARTIAIKGGNPGSAIHQFLRSDYEKYFVGACIDQIDIPEMNLEEFVDLIHNQNLEKIAHKYALDDLMLVGGESTVTSVSPPDSARSTLLRTPEDWHRLREQAKGRLQAMANISPGLNREIHSDGAAQQPLEDHIWNAAQEMDSFQEQAHELSRSLFKMLMALLFYLNSDERSVMEFSSREDRDELEGKIKRSRPKSGKKGKRSSGQNKKEKAKDRLRDMPSANFHHVGYDVDRAIGSQLGYDYEQRRHWRRGHVHRFWTGKLKAENGEEIPREEWDDPANDRKRIKKWVRPTLINPDKEWVECTTRYVEKGDFGAIRDAADRATFVEGQKEPKVRSEGRRNPKAREKCLEWYGAQCVVCGFEAKGMYEDEDVDGIHVHHLNPLGDSDDGVVTDAIEDLRPLCVPCHQVAHRKKPPYTIQEIKQKVSHQFKKDADGRMRIVYDDDLTVDKHAQTDYLP